MEALNLMTSLAPWSASKLGKQLTSGGPLVANRADDNYFGASGFSLDGNQQQRGKPTVTKGPAFDGRWVDSQKTIARFPTEPGRPPRTEVTGQIRVGNNAPVKVEYQQRGNHWVPNSQASKVLDAQLIKKTSEFGVKELNQLQGQQTSLFNQGTDLADKRRKLADEFRDPTKPATAVGLTDDEYARQRTAALAEIKRLDGSISSANLEWKQNAVAIKAITDIRQNEIQRLADEATKAGLGGSLPGFAAICRKNGVTNFQLIEGEDGGCGEPMVDTFSAGNTSTNPETFPVTNAFGNGDPSGQASDSFNPESSAPEPTTSPSDAENFSTPIELE